MSVPIEALPDDARVWVYGSNRRLDDTEVAAVRDDLTSFVDRWTAHGAQLEAAADVIENRFVIVAVDERAASASGCSIDAMVHHLAELEGRLSCSLLDSTRIFYREDTGDIEAVDRAAFREVAAAGALGAETRVFDPTLATLGELRAGKLERPLADSWHRRLVSEALDTT
ncbi:MAG: hypothetical protein MJB57_16635 [Gemmatimonadetes bacterium]|nr:hypothetical protein [Gemmatimonadota bacterium]